MAEPNRNPYTESQRGIPRWVVLVGTVLIIVALLAAVMMLSGGGLGGHVPPKH